MTRKCTIANTHTRYFGKCRLQCGKKLCLKHAVNLIPLIIIGYISADISIEQQWIYNLIRILSITANGNIYIQTYVLIHNTKRNWISRSIFISYNFFRIKEIYPLVFPCLASETKPFSDRKKSILNICTKTSIENTWLCRSVVDKFSRLCTNIHNLALVYNNHTLSFIHSYNRTITDNVLRTFGIASPSCYSFLAFFYQNLRPYGITMKIIPPLICQYTIKCTCSCF